MEINLGRLDKFHFSGDEEMNTTIGASIITDQSASYPDLIRATGVGGVVRLTSDDHGFKATPDVWKRDESNLIYVQGVGNGYDGLRTIVAVATNTVDLLCPFTADITPGGTETLRPGFSYPEKAEFWGFSLHLDAASATTEDLEIHIDAAQGAAWDRKLYDYDMNGVQNIEDILDEPIPLSPNDIVYVTWANTNNTLWGLTLYGRRVV